MLAAGLAAVQPAAAQFYMNDPGFQKGPVQGDDPLVGLPIPGATPAEYRAHLLWNMRAGLNVAALQCQFSPYLRTVDNYNGLLAHHSKELASAYTALNAYFKRTGGAAGQKAFDDYTTITYNNFSTLQAQLGFCQTAASIGKEALTRPKGQLYTLAEQRMRELRSSLVASYKPTLIPFNPQSIRLAPVPPLQEDCWNKRNELRVKCGGIESER
ncbi:MAG TPA: hypothetical protein VF628_06170 [Allosphingosinicella sp.]